MKAVLRFVLIAFLAPLAAAAAGPAEQTPNASPNARYIIVLKDPEQMPAGAKEPDVRKHGGKEHGRWGTRRSVELPAQAIEALRKDPAVLFITRVNTGNGEIPEEIIASSEGRRMSTEAVAVPPQWDSGDYAYDGSGNIKKIGNDTYVYDDVNRLVKATVNGKVETYQYDSFGNMTEHITDGVQIATPVDKLTNRSIGTSYDVAGNQTTSYGVEQVYRYDGVNMMTQKADYTLATDRFLYTVDDERIGTGRMDEWTWVIRDFNGKPLSEFDSGPFTDWLWLENDYYRDGALASSSRPLAWGGARHFHLDHLGTPRLITNDAREKLAAHDYYPFGREQTLMNQEWVNRNGDRPTTLKFTGHERDFIARNDPADTRYLDYMHARYYNPNMGRFLSVDPVLGKAEAPQSWNRYSYVMNSPVSHVDLDGREIVCLQGGFVGDPDAIRPMGKFLATLYKGNRVVAPVINYEGDHHNDPQAGVNVARSFKHSKGSAKVVVGTSTGGDAAAIAAGKSGPRGGGKWDGVVVIAAQASVIMDNVESMAKNSREVVIANIPDDTNWGGDRSYETVVKSINDKYGSMEAFQKKFPNVSVQNAGDQMHGGAATRQQTRDAVYRGFEEAKETP